MVCSLFYLGSSYLVKNKLDNLSLLTKIDTFVKKKANEILIFNVTEVQKHWKILLWFKVCVKKISGSYFFIFNKNVLFVSKFWLI